MTTAAAARLKVLVGMVSSLTFTTFGVYSTRISFGFLYGVYTGGSYGGSGSMMDAMVGGCGRDWGASTFTTFYSFPAALFFTCHLEK